MIGKIKGKLVEVDGNIGLIETSSGVFYQLFLTPSVLNSQSSNKLVEVYTYLQVREDALILFGFKTKYEFIFFKLLLNVDGVGPKTAFLVVSFSKIEDLKKAIKEHNVEYLTRIPGLGKKTSLKIMLELSTKLEEEFSLEKVYLSQEDKTVIDALISLGFKSNEAKSIFSRIPKNLSLEEKIKQGLRLASSPRK